MSLSTHPLPAGTCFQHAGIANTSAGLALFVDEAHHQQTFLLDPKLCRGGIARARANHRDRFAHEHVVARFGEFVSQPHQLGDRHRWLDNGDAPSEEYHQWMHEGASADRASDAPLVDRIIAYQHQPRCGIAGLDINTQIARHVAWIHTTTRSVRWETAFLERMSSSCRSCRASGRRSHALRVLRPTGRARRCCTARSA